MFPFLDRVYAAKHILIAGCGGGFDVFAGLPLATHLMARGISVTFANLSFSSLWQSGGTRIDPTCWRVDLASADLPYFPERWLAEWLAQRDIRVPIYAFAKSGVRPLEAAYRAIVDLHGIDLVVLVDGGTDSVIFGDEPGLGTIVEDAVSIVAATRAAGDRTLLAAIGFGVDHFHGVSHYAFLENVARLSRDGGFLGSFGLTSGTPEADDFVALVDYANQRQPLHRSIVCNSIAGALQGAFGNAHATNRTSGSELFINSLMTQYWTFKAARVVGAMAFADALVETESFTDASRAIEIEREYAEIRPRRPLPL